MNFSPHVSIVVPNYNHSRFLEQRLESIYNQTFQDFEVILLDDCSTDHSREILSGYKDHPKTSHCIFNKVNSGSPFKQWDKGIALAKGEFVWIAESDDYCSEVFIETLINSFQDQKISLAYCQSYRLNSENEIKGSWLFHTREFGPGFFEEDFIMDGNVFIENFLVHKNVIPNVSAVLFRKKELERIMPLTIKPFLRYNADWYYYIQILCNSRLSFVAKPENYFRFHDSSVISSAGAETGELGIFKMEMQGREFMRDYLGKCKPKNLRAILSSSRKGDKKLRRKFLSGFIEENQFSAVKFINFKYPELMPFSFLYYLRKRFSK
ncbi:glycosyltransferase family 2 protein [Christiangramia echinicola]|uniref:Glycosyltransferase involved in cell wall bisynthesis n=1 Tax=Christiangramia echinicola TaxID=279359 RepID=A0A1H1L564_9FLAO|nr:glycosyltransferase family A protein [Christiangramia echinicola]SDR69165.1 Glycosyltransferase involved in cell wall bisynthesis [Christiangramia echinicola]